MNIYEHSDIGLDIFEDFYNLMESRDLSNSITSATFPGSNSNICYKSLRMPPPGKTVLADFSAFDQ